MSKRVTKYMSKLYSDGETNFHLNKLHDVELSNKKIVNNSLQSRHINRLKNMSNFYLDGKNHFYKQSSNMQVTNIEVDHTNITQNNNISDIPDIPNIHKIYIIASNYVLNEGETLKKVFQDYNIQSEVININKENISDELYREVLNNNDRIILAIGVINIKNPELLHKLNTKCLVYQIEQKNILSERENYLLKLFLKGMPNIVDFSHNNNYYYKNVDVLIPFIETQTNSNSKDIDVLFYGSMSNRRLIILDALFNLNKYKIKFVDKCFGKELLDLISRSKIVLNLHYSDNSFFEIFRINLAISYNTHIVSEIPTIDNEEYLYKLYKNLVYFVPKLNKDNFYQLDKLISNLLIKPVIKSHFQLNEINKINNISQKVLFENLNYIIDSTINNLRKSNLDESLFHKYYLKLEKTDNKIKYNVIKTIISDYFIERKYYAHLHCYDISKFNEIYGEYINIICRYFSVIVTYSIGNNTIDNNSDLVILKIPNKGMDIGGKFCAVKYLNSNEISYEYILFLHSKSNPETRIKYFKPLIDNLDDEFIKNINENDGYFPDIQWEIVGDKLKMISGNPEFADSNLPERNILYRNKLLKYLGANNETNYFIEGNCYILSKRVIDKLYTDPLLYNILNTETCFDYNWVSKAYNIHGDIYQVYKQFQERKLAPRNQNSFDGYLEHVFERVVLNFCDNYRIINDKSINIIGLKNINVSIADNLVLLKNYLNKLNKNSKIYIYDISEIEKINYNIKTIFCIQPFEIRSLVPFLSNLKIKPEILWVWEFKSLPQIFKDYEKYFSKVYVPSQFCYDIFSKHLSIPIEKVELKSMIHDYIDKIPDYKIKNQKINNILENTKNKTIYGFCFDLNSSIVRKNPLNLVRAFNNLNDETKVLILKYRYPRGNKFINKIESDIYNSFIIEVKKNKNIYCITDELEQLDLYKLYTNFDYYITPHCGEGFGLTIYDNMILGNIIISPYYSGETEYLKREDIIRLEYEEKQISGLKEHPVYGQMKDFKGAYISVESIMRGLNNIIGDEIYILGNGPSLKNCDFNFLKYKTTFALNSSYKKFAELDFYPTYFGCFDPKLIECHYDKFVQLMNDNNKIKKFFFLNENNKGQKQFSFQDENNSRYQKINFLPPQESYINKSSFNKFYKMHNSGATAALISILLGYKNIILLGCDGNYVEQIPETRLIDASTKTLQILKTPEKNPNYWFDNYQEKGEIYSVPDGNSCHMKGWELLYQASKIHNIEIINENTESKIPYFSKLQNYIDKNIIVYGLYYNNQLTTHKHTTSKIYKNNNFSYINDVNLSNNQDKYNFLKNRTGIIIDGITETSFKHLFHIFKTNNMRIIGTIYLTNINDNENKYLEIYNQYKVPIYIDNYFIYKKFKNIIPINLHLILIKYSPPVQYKNKKIFLTIKRIKNYNTNVYLKLIKDKHNFAKISTNNYNNEFKESSIIIIKEDDFNYCRSSKKLFDSIIDNKIIIIENKNNYLVDTLKYINYPNYILFDNLEQLDNILTNIKIDNIKYFDSKILNNKFVTYDDSDGILKYKLFIRSQSQKVVLIGNGPSSKDIDFKKINFATIGMNVAFRHWYKINWFPDIYCCLDVELIKCHFSAISELIKNEKCQKFFLRKHFHNICKNNNIKIPEENVYYLEDMKHILFESNKHITTGAYALRFALFLGYIDIRLIGIDSNYINYVENCDKKDDSIKSTALIIKYDKPSVNYFFDDYQKKGDVYNIPNVDEDFICKCKYCNGNNMNHKDLHNKVFDFIIKDKENIKEYQNVSIKNYSQISQLKQFKKEKIELIYD